MFRLAGGLAFAVLASAATPAAVSVGTARPDPPRRVVSLNLCADPLVLALADPGQIAALSPYARDPILSSVARKAASEPVTGGAVEAVMAMRPDLVILGPYRRQQTRVLLRRFGVRVLDLPAQESAAGIEKAIAAVASAVGRPERGRALTASFRARLAGIGPPPGHGRVAAYYQRRGYLTGTGTLVDDMMRRAGLTNLAVRLHRRATTQLSLEELALARPDFLVLETESGRDDQGVEMLHHPLLEDVVPPARRLYVPEAMTVCGGPVYAEAVARLAQEIRAADALSTRSPPGPSRPSGTGASPPPSR